MLGETLIVRTGQHALHIRAEYMRRGGDVGAFLPEGFGNETIIGEPVPLQVKRFVEGTIGFDAWERGRLAEEDFIVCLERDLPREFIGPHSPAAGIEIEEALRAQDAPFLEAIDEKYRRRYPGFKLD